MTDQAQWVAACTACGEQIGAGTTPVPELPACPACGTDAPIVSLSVHEVGHIEVVESTRIVGRHGEVGQVRPYLEHRNGADWSHALQRFVYKVRILDRDNDRYVEKVVDPETGDVLRDVEEPLSEHQGRGSARPAAHHQDEESSHRG